MKAIGELFTRLLRGPAASAVLRRFGIDPKRYWLLMDLFGQLAERREMFGQLGRNSIQLKGAAYLYFTLMGFMALLMIFLAGPPVAHFFWVFQLISAVILFMILMPETGNSLVNPDEALVLAHQPIDGATYNAAKLSHLLRIVLFLVPGINGVAAVGGLFLKDAGLWYPLKHLAAALIAGVAVAFICCAIFGWLIRFVPAPRLKALTMMAEAFPFVFIVIPKRNLPEWVVVPPEYRVAIAVVLASIALIGVAVGLRSLSGDYLIRVAAIMGGRSARRAAVRTSPLDNLVARWFGGQAARAGFAYSKLLMRRDWQFRRQLLVLLPFVIVFGGLLFRSSRTSPFTEEFTPIHFMPHFYALVCLLLCLALPYGTHYKAVWVFLTFPAGAFGGFARGVHALLWIAVVLAPHALLLAVFGYWWGPWDAILFVAYSAAVASLYLGLALRLVEGIPFGRPAETTRSDIMMPLMIVGGIVIGAVVLLQWLVLFRSRELVGAATLLAAAGSYFATRSSLRAFAGSIRYRLSLLSTESKQLYTEVDL